MSGFRRRVFLFFIVTAGVLLAAGAAMADPPPPRPQPVAPRAGRPVGPPPGANATLVAVAGPETRGAEIAVAGRVIRLPADAYVEHFTVSVHCVVGMPCPQTPIYELRRGNSTIAVSAPSGAIVEERRAPGDDRAFDFLREALR